MGESPWILQHVKGRVIETIQVAKMAFIHESFISRKDEGNFLILFPSPLFLTVPGKDGVLEIFTRHMTRFKFCQ